MAKYSKTSRRGRGQRRTQRRTQRRAQRGGRWVYGQPTHGHLPK